MKSEFYKKLVDLYAGGELPTELESEIIEASKSDLELKIEMDTIKGTVDTLRSMPDPTFGEESYQRILLKLYTRGVEVQTQTPIPLHIQYQLPISG